MGYGASMSHLPDEWSGEDSEDGAEARDLARVQDDELERSITQLMRTIDSLQAMVALRVAEYDRRGLARERHVLSTKQWLAHSCRVTPSQAATILRTGKALESMPSVASVAVDGAAPTGAVRALAAARDRHPVAFTRHEAILADAATYLSPRDLRRAIAHWEQQVAYPDALTETAEKRRRRRFSISQTWDGMWALSGELDPESGLVVSTALRERLEGSNLDPTDLRTHPQKMADNLADVCRYSLDQGGSPSTSGGAKPHITVTVDHRTLTLSEGPDKGLLPELDGSPVDPETIRRLACDANVVRMIMGPDSEPLDIGRATRTIPTAIRRALDQRDEGCTWQGCDAPPQWCDAHHIEHWADGGPTSLENLTLLCRRHHTATHEMGSGGTDPPPDV